METSRTRLLLELRRVCESIPDDLLHMRSLEEQSPCGTARCLLGWARLDPWLQENSELGTTSAVPSWMFFNYVYSHDLARIFQVSRDDASHLFALDINRDVPEHAVSKSEVLWNLDQLIAGKPALPYCATANRFSPPYASDNFGDSP